MTFLKGWKTLIFNVATSLAAIAEMYDIINIVSPDQAPLAVLVVTVANAILRFMTTTPVASKV